MDLDNEFISRFLKEIGSMKYGPQFDVNYRVKDGVALSDVRSIDYSWMDVEIRSRVYYSDECVPLGMPSMAMNPKSIEISDNVTVVWNIL